MSSGAARLDEVDPGSPAQPDRMTRTFLGKAAQPGGTLAHLRGVRVNSGPSVAPT